MRRGKGEAITPTTSLHHRSAALAPLRYRRTLVAAASQLPSESTYEHMSSGLSMACPIGARPSPPRPARRAPSARAALVRIRTSGAHPVHVARRPRRRWTGHRLPFATAVARRSGVRIPHRRARVGRRRAHAAAWGGRTGSLSQARCRPEPACSMPCRTCLPGRVRYHLSPRLRRPQVDGPFPLGAAGHNPSRARCGRAVDS